MKYLRTVVLHLFKRSFCNNEFDYKTSLDSVFKGRIPTSFKNCPSFTEKKLEEVLRLHFLTEDGLLVINYIIINILLFIKYRL